MRQMFGCVHFAGEATHDGSCATTQSAVLTGERAAAEVIVELKREEDDFEEIVMDAKLWDVQKKKFATRYPFTKN